MEQIEKILEKVRDELLKQLHPMVHTNGYPSEAVPKGTILEIPALLKKEIAALYEGWYPREFVIWIGFESPGRLMYRELDNSWLHLNDIDDTDSWTLYTLPDLFKFWQDNVEGK